MSPPLSLIITSTMKQKVNEKTFFQVYSTKNHYIDIDISLLLLNFAIGNSR